MAMAMVAPVSMVSSPVSSHSRSTAATVSRSATSRLEPLSAMVSYSIPEVRYSPSGP